MQRVRTCGEGVSAWKRWLSSYGEDVALVLLLVVLTLVVQAWTASGVSAVPVSGRALLVRSVAGDTLDSVRVLCASVGAHDSVDMSLATSGESIGFGCLHVFVWLMSVVLICWCLQRCMALSVPHCLSSSSPSEDVVSVHAGAVARAVARLQLPVDRTHSVKKSNHTRVQSKRAIVVRPSRPVVSSPCSVPMAQPVSCAMPDFGPVHACVLGLLDAETSVRRSADALRSALGDSAVDALPSAPPMAAPASVPRSSVGVSPQEVPGGVNLRCGVSPQEVPGGVSLRCGVSRHDVPGGVKLRSGDRASAPSSLYGGTAGHGLGVMTFLSQLQPASASTSFDSVAIGNISSLVWCALATVALVVVVAGVYACRGKLVACRDAVRALVTVAAHGHFVRCSPHVCNGFV